MEGVEGGVEGVMTRQTEDPRNAGGPCEGAPGEMRIDEYLDRIAEELHERVEHQRTVLRAALGAGGGTDGIRYCPLVDCARIEALRSAIRETIAVLEETRSAFKSKRLEAMRKKLSDILAER
jgi:hypothetical protein